MGEENLYHWKKHGLLFNPETHPGKDWMVSYAQAPATLVLDNIVRVYFSCRPKPDAHGQFSSYSAYVDLDRRNLFNILDISNEPVLELGEAGTFDEFGTYPFTVIPYKNEYLAYYGGWTRCESVPFNVSIGVAKSKDGKVFSRLGTGPILTHTPDEPFILSGPKIRRFNNKFYLFYIAGTKWVLSEDGKPEPVYKIRMAISVNGIDWHKVNKPLIVDSIGVNEAQASPDVTFSGGKYHMFFCYREALDYRDNKNNSYRIGYAWSKDLLHWTRVDKSNLNVSSSGWDSEMVAYPHILELDGKTWMFYLGNKVGEKGFGLAELGGSL